MNSNESMGYVPPGAETWRAPESQIVEAVIETVPVNNVENVSVANIHSELPKHGYLLDAETPPYKSFGHGERFYIAKCMSSQNKEAVVKIASPDEISRGALDREAHLYDVLAQSIIETTATGQTVGIGFPEKIDQFEIDNQTHQLAVVTNFVRDDKAAKAVMSPEQKIALIGYAIQEMNKLTVPQAEVQKAWNERSVKIETPQEIAWHGHRMINELADPRVGMISPTEAEQLRGHFEKVVPLLERYPLKFDHGDLHGGNIAYSRNAETGNPEITLMDIETLKVSNEFSAIAQLANREALRSKLTKFDTLLSQTPKYKAQIEEALAFIPDGTTAALEKAFVKNESDRQVLQTMRLFEVLTVLSNEMNLSQNDTTGEMKRSLYKDLLSDQIEQLNKEILNQ